jgi:arsenate reductase
MNLPKKRNVLFLCTGNSARSQIAEGLLRARAGEWFEPYSAGMSPKGIHPMAVQVMNEIGIDITGQRSKDVKEYLGRLWVHYLVIVCDNANNTCPRIFPGLVERFFWPLEDPPAFAGTDEERLEKFREVRDQLDERIQAWVKVVQTSGKKPTGGQVG